MLRSQTRRLSRLAEDVSAVSRAEEHQLDLSISLVPPGHLVTATIGAAGSHCSPNTMRMTSGATAASRPKGSATATTKTAPASRKTSGTRSG